MSHVGQSRRVAPVAYRAVDPAAALALGAVLFGLGTLFSGIADWEWRFDLSYWADLARQLASTGIDAVVTGGTQLLAGLAQVTYSSLTDSAPILMAALLLALFVLGPSEILSAVTAKRRV